MKSYKGWTPAQRQASYKKTMKAIKDGVIPPATKCELCGQTEGKVMYHNEDYSHPTKYLMSMCWTCHMMWHSKYRSPRSYRIYFYFVNHLNWRPEPVYKHDFKKLEKYCIFDKKGE